MPCPSVRPSVRLSHAVEVRCFLTQQFNCCTYAARCAGALSCWNTKSLPDTLRIAGSSMTSLWRREAASKKSVLSKIYHQNFLFCNNNEITACIADLFNSFCEEVYEVAFFKMMQRHIIGKVENSIIYWWAELFSCCSAVEIVVSLPIHSHYRGCFLT